MPFIPSAILSLAAALSAAAPQPIGPEAARPYLTRQSVVEIAPGRKLNLVCMGNGPRTVLFDAGGSDWSVVWALVQPIVARQARACAYDRAGLGLSDPASGPRSPVAIVEDLHALIPAAKLPSPLVLVGHSLGGFDVKLHAALYPGDVAGLVLVDPAEERQWDRTRTMIRKRFGERSAASAELQDQSWFVRLADHYRACDAAARPGGLEPASAIYKRCTDPVRPVLGPEIAEARQRVQASATYQAAQASEIVNSIYGDQRADPIYARLFQPGAFGSKPMIVLTHGVYDENDPLDVLSYIQGLALHRESARLSRRGIERILPGTTHHIEHEAPQAVAEAIDEVLRGLDGNAAPGKATKAK